MTILQSETSLTTAQYNAIKNGEAQTAIQVIAHRYNPLFETFSTSPLTADNDSADFSILALADGSFLKIADTSMEKWVPGTDTWTAVAAFTAPTNPLDTSMAMILDGSTVSVYACTLTGLQVNTSTDNGVTWSGWSTFYANPSGSPSGYIYGSDATSGQTFASSSSGQSNAFDDNNATDWTSGTVPSVSQYIQVTFAATKAITRYSVRAPAAAADVNNAPRSWNLYAGTTLVQSVVTDPWTAGEIRYFSIQSEHLGAGSITDTVWKLDGLLSHNGGAVKIAEIEMMETTTTGVPEITQVAADAAGRVHFVVKDNTKQIYNFRIAEWNGVSWDVSSSDIWWPFDIEGFEVCTLADRDVVIFTSHVPGTKTAVQNGDSYLEKIYVSGGVFAIVYRNGYWSQHIVVESLDNLNNYRWREYIKATVINGLIHLSCYSSDGTESFPFLYYRHYESRDGEFWSIGDIMPFPDDVGGWGVKLIDAGDYVYGFEKKIVYRSPMTLYFGSSPAAQQVDITPYINAYGLSQSKAMQSSIELSNPGGYFDNHAVIDPDNTILLYHYSGGWVDGVKSLLQVAISEVDSLQFDDEIAKRMIQIQVRDKFSWMSDKTVSEQAVYRKSQTQGGDKYRDYNDSQYGGMSHTARQTGSWRTANGYLYNDSDWVEAIAFNTQNTNVWNGAISTSWIFTYNSADVYAGVVFRAVDASNLWYAAFDFADNKIHLYERRNGVDTQMAISASAYAGWVAVDQMKHMRVEFRYANIKVYIAEDSIGAFDQARTWTEVIDYDMNCSRYVYDETYLKLLQDTPFHRGYTGLIAYTKNEGSVHRYWRTQTFDYELPNTIESSFRWYASLSKLHSPSFDKLYRVTPAGWVLDGSLTINVETDELVWDNGTNLWNDGVLWL